MFLICTAENSVLWEKLCKSVSLNTVSSIKNIERSKAFNIVQKPVTKQDITPALSRDANVNIVLVTTTPVLQLASSYSSLKAVTVADITFNLQSTLAVAESSALKSIVPVTHFFEDLRQTKALADIAHYFSGLPALEFSHHELSVAKLIIELEPEIASLSQQVQCLMSEQSASQTMHDSIVGCTSNELISLMQKLHQSSEERDALIEQLTISQIEAIEQAGKNRSKEISLEQDVSVLTSQLFVIQKQIEEGGVAASGKEGRSTRTLASKNKELELKIAKMAEKLVRKSQAEKQLRLKVAELRNIEQSSSWKVTKNIEKLRAKVSRNAKQRNQLLEDVTILYNSDYFDADWYLTTYKDVRESGIDPAEHYLLFGAKEGRRPSLEFDGDWYLKKNEDVAQSGMNPLLHFLKYGKSEKRSPSRFSAF